MTLIRLMKRLRQARGATVVEYSLIVALVVVVLIGAVEALSDSAGDELSDNGDEIGHPVEPPGSTTTTTGSGTTTTVATTTTLVAPYDGAVELVACVGSNGHQNECSFTLNPAPAVGAVVVWTVDPPTGYTGAPPAMTFTDKGKRTVQATVDGTAADPLEVQCTETGNPKLIKCD